MLNGELSIIENYSKYIELQIITEIIYVNLISIAVFCIGNYLEKYQ